MTTIETLLQYLIQGDLLGFFQAIYASAFLGYGELLYGLGTLALILPIYIRTNSLLLMSILWILVGTLVAVAMPMVSVIAFVMMIFGFGGVLFKVYMAMHSSGY